VAGPSDRFETGSFNNIILLTPYRLYCLSNCAILLFVEYLVEPAGFLTSLQAQEVFFSSIALSHQISSL